ncbi:hypothetical protein BDR05DRAFT_961774 [Suillus weaverae]|nr:hypothetical protein BDR05DRAFT_961774 [Suillus weaverae]
MGMQISKSPPPPLKARDTVTHPTYDTYDLGNIVARSTSFVSRDFTDMESVNGYYSWSSDMQRVRTLQRHYSDHGRPCLRRVSCTPSFLSCLPLDVANSPVIGSLKLSSIVCISAFRRPQVPAQVCTPSSPSTLSKQARDLLYSLIQGLSYSP